MRKDKEKETEFKTSQPAEFPDDITIDSIAAYERSRLNNPWGVEGMREDRHYFFASQETGHSAQNVAALKRRGYIVSELKHENPDLILMESPKKLFEVHKMQDLIQDQRNRKKSFEPQGIPENHNLGGGIYRLPTHGMSKPK